MDGIDVVIGVFILGYVIKLAGDRLRGKKWGYKKLDWIGREGVDWGPVHMTAFDDEFVVERNKYRSILRWPAILGVVENKQTLFLNLTRNSAIIVPKSRFASVDDMQSFRDFVAQRIKASS